MSIMHKLSKYHYFLLRNETLFSISPILLAHAELYLSVSRISVIIDTCLDTFPFVYTLLKSC